MVDSQATSAATGEQESPAGADADAGQPGFGARGRMRRRARFLRKARELAYRDLGGLVYSLHQFGKRNDGLVLAKLETIGRIDNELRALEEALQEREPVTVLREAGVAACARCAAIHGSEDRFCPNCGLAMDLRAERPMAGAPAAASGPSVAASSPPVDSSPATSPPPAASPPAASAPATASPASSPQPAASAPTTQSREAAATDGQAGPATRELSTQKAGTETARPAGEGDAGAGPVGPGPALEEPTEIIRPSVKSP
jgi:hypothetical protein